GIKRYEVFAERHPVAVPLDEIRDVRDVTAVGFARNPRPWSADDVAHRQVLIGVALYGDGLVVPRHQHHAVRRLPPHWATTDRLVIAVRVVDERLVGEEVEILGSAHSVSVALHCKSIARQRYAPRGSAR